MIGLNEIIGAAATGLVGMVGFAYQKHSKRMDKIETELDEKVTEKGVNDKLAPLSVKLDLIFDSVKEVKEELTRLRKY